MNGPGIKGAVEIRLPGKAVRLGFVLGIKKTENFLRAICPENTFQELFFFKDKAEKKPISPVFFQEAYELAEGILDERGNFLHSFLETDSGPG